MTVTEARALFPGLRDKVFLDAACVSLVPESARQAVSDFLDMAMRCDADDASLHHIQMDVLRQKAIQQGARLLNCGEHNLALIESTTHGLNIAAGVLPLQRGDEVLIANTEFLQVAIPWYKKSESAGIEIIPVPCGKHGALTLADFESRIHSRTRVVCVSSVQWCSGYRLDMAALGELCKSEEIWLVVDAIQEMGAMQIDMSKQHADFVIAGGHKWLNAPFGCGLLWLSDRVLATLEPLDFGYLALQEPDGGWGEYFRTPTITPYRDYQFQRSAKRFEIAGTSNYPGAVGLGAALQLVNEIGIAEVETHIRKLTGLLHDELRSTPVKVVTSDGEKERSGITVFSVDDDLAKTRRLLDKLLDERIYLAMRYTSGIGGIRISTHFFNNEDDVMRLVTGLKKYL